MRKFYAVGVALFAAFVILASLVVFDRSSITGPDYRAFEAMNKPDGRIVSQIMVDLTKYGREEVWIAATALLFVLGGKDGKKTAGLLFITFAILIPLGTGIKDAIDRPRPTPVMPQNLLVPSDKDSSFPSGHAVIVSAGAFVVLARFSRKRQMAVALTLLVEALLVIYSRVYVGAHYPLDLVGGTLLGAGTASLVVGSDRYFYPVFSRLYSMAKR